MDDMEQTKRLKYRPITQIHTQGRLRYSSVMRHQWRASDDRKRHRWRFTSSHAAHQL